MRKFRFRETGSEDVRCSISWSLRLNGLVVCSEFLVISCYVLQVRCMMAVLLLIGQKLEAPDIINQLLDVENNPRKPQYR